MSFHVRKEGIKRETNIGNVSNSIYQVQLGGTAIGSDLDSRRHPLGQKRNVRRGLDEGHWPARPAEARAVGSFPVASLFRWRRARRPFWKEKKKKKFVVVHFYARQVSMIDSLEFGTRLQDTLTKLGDKIKTERRWALLTCPNRFTRRVIVPFIISSVNNIPYDKNRRPKTPETPSKNPNNNNNRDSLYPLDGKAFFPFSRIQNTTKESIFKRITSFLFHLFFIRDKNDEGLRNRKGELYGLFVSLRLRKGGGLLQQQHQQS